MIQVVWIARYREGLAREAASRHWREVHGALAAKVPGLGHYVQTHVVETLPPGGKPFDGYSYGWFADRAAYDAALRTPEWAAVVADSGNVFDNGFFAGMSGTVEELVLRDGPPGAVKLAFVVRYRTDIAREAALAHWRGTHGDLALRIPGLVRYVQNRAIEPLGVPGVEGGETLAFDGIAELWFKDRAALEAAAQSPEWRACGVDGAGIFHMPGLWIAEVEEHVIKAG